MTRDLLDSIHCPYTTRLESTLDMVHLGISDVGYDDSCAIAHGAANLWC
jgi:hypothetical protein